MRLVSVSAVWGGCEQPGLLARWRQGQASVCQPCFLVNFRNVVCVWLTFLQREKEASGLADVPGGAKGKLLEVEFAFTEDKKLRGQLRDANAIEAQVRQELVGTVQ